MSDNRRTRTRKGAPGIVEVAARAGVSPATVSRFFNNPAIVRPKTRLKIEKAAEDLGFIRDRMARLNVSEVCFSQSAFLRARRSSRIAHKIEFFDEKLWNIIEYNDGDDEGGGDHLPTIESLSRAYIQWLDHVRQTAKQLNTTLLEYNVKQGWEPLCDYLGLDDSSSSSNMKCPPINTAFPHVNDSKEWILILGIVRFVSNYWIHLLIVITILCITILLKMVMLIRNMLLFSTKKTKFSKRKIKMR